MAEIGVLSGRLSEYLLRRRRDLYMVLVDSWCDGSGHSEEYVATGDRHAGQSQAAADLSRAAAERKIAPFRSRITVLWMPSLQAVDRINDRSLDLVFIDADHSYEGVRADIAAWLSKISPGGCLSGHDYNHPDPAFRFGVKRAVDEFVAERDLELQLDEDKTWFVRLP